MLIFIKLLLVTLILTSLSFYICWVYDYNAWLVIPGCIVVTTLIYFVTEFDPEDI
jgi:hypothetical protein